MNCLVNSKKIKILRSDNACEFTSKSFKSLCKESGIKRELSTPYNPQQSGVAERKNRIIMEAVKAMIHDQDLSMNYGRKQPEQQFMSKTEHHTVC